ncbi:MAG TPA: hypothetical protein VE953_15320 [Terriglobales bacterium]|nr:hypothetical protein [Terriglobales bacterium]
MLIRATGVLNSARRLLAFCLPAAILAGLLPAALPTPAAAGGGPFTGMTATANDVPVGTPVTVTSTTSFNVGPTPWWTQIYDLSTGARVVACPTGTICSGTVNSSSPASSNSAIPHFGRFVAYVGSLSNSPPPANNQGASSEVDVAWNAIDIHLSGVATNVTTTQYTFTVTATTAVDVGPTPYYTEIFNINTGALVGVCGRGTSCTATTTLAVGPTIEFQGFVTNYSGSVPTTFQGASLYLSTGGKG